MAFKTNDSQQYSLTDSMNHLTSRELKALEKSWANVFAEDIFPAIDEEPFRVLYSSRTQCRANTPVNICIGALIIKEMFQNSDDDIVESLMLDTLMIEANIKHLSRAELLYTCVSRFVIYLHKNKQDSFLAGLEHYYDPDATFREKAGKQ